MNSLFKLPESISFSQQAEICKLVKEKGVPVAFNLDGNKQYLWKGMLLRKLNPEKLNSDLVSLFAKNERSIDFCLRHRSDLEWIWENSELSEKVQNVVSKIEKYFKQIMRVQILLQRPFVDLPAHTDLVAGNVYGNLKYLPFQNEVFAENNFHENNDYLALKIPLTERENENGFPFVEIDGESYYYDVGQNVFAIDESRIKHGANCSGHWRGVVSIDGVLNLEEIRKNQLPTSITNTKRQKIFRRTMVSKRESTSTPFIGGHDDDRLDVRAVFQYYAIMRMQSVEFLGAIIEINADRLSLFKREYWSSDEEQVHFYLRNRDFIQRMVDIYEKESRTRGITTTRFGETIDYDVLKEEERKCLSSRGFIILNRP